MDVTVESTTSNAEAESANDKTCLNCGTPIDGEFCKVCGQASSTERYTFNSLAQEIYAQLRKVEAAKTLKTIWALTFSPGSFVQGYLAGKRTDYINPVRFFFYGFFIELTTKVAVVQLLPGNPIIENTQGGISLELLNLGITIVWGVLWSIVYYKEQFNLIEYIVAAIFFVGQTFVFSAVVLLMILPFTNALKSPSATHTIVDLAIYFGYSCIFAYALFNVRWPVLVLKQALVGFLYILFIWGLFKLGVLSILNR